MSSLQKSLDALLIAIKNETKDYNNADVKFMKEMIKHHEMAVEMADKEIDKGKESSAIALAKKIKTAQKSEIDQMKKWLADREETSGGMGGM